MTVINQEIYADDYSAYNNLGGRKTPPKVKARFIDLATLERDKNESIAKIDKQALIAKSAIEAEYRNAIARLASDLKKAQTDIAKADKLSKKKPSVSRAESMSKVRSQKITSQSLLKRLEEFEGCCAYCYEHLGKNKQVDHVMPISKLGADVLENIVYACQSCNCSKGDRDPIKWYRSQPFWSEVRESKLLSVTGRLDSLTVE